MRTWLVLLAAAGSLGACTSTPDDAGTMTSDQYRSLESKGTNLTVDDVVERGGVQSTELEEQFLTEGGSAADPSFECWFAETTRRTKALGVARFCFADGAVQTVERNRSDVP